MSIIKLNNVSKKYSNGTTALRNISLDIEAGEFVYIVGPSGAGKSTFIKLLYHELKIDKGTGVVAKFDLMKLKRRDVPLLRRSVGVVFQDYKLLPKKTVYENIAYAMEVVGKRPREIKKRVNEVLDLVGLKHKLRSFPDELSGGEQQRVAIARAIAKNPKILLCDEPTGALDYQTGKHVLKILQDMSRVQGATVIIVTHNAAISQIADRIIHVHDGRVKEITVNDSPADIETIEW